MFGKQPVRQVIQVVSLEDLARFIRQVAPQGQQPQTSISITINGDLHIHQAPAQSAMRLPTSPSYRALPEPDSVAWPDPREDAGMSLDYLDRALGALAVRNR